MTLISLRQQLDSLDKKLLKLLLKRQQIIKKVARVKSKAHLKIHQPLREAEIINNKLKLARQLNLNQSFIKHLFQLILKESKRLQRSLIK